MRIFLRSFLSSSVVVAGTGLLLSQPVSSSKPSYTSSAPGEHAVETTEQASEDAWFAHVKVLASDELKGRLTGSPEFIHAVGYVEEQFKAIGLRPGGVDGFQQPVKFRTVVTDTEHSSLQLMQPGKPNLTLKLGSEASLNPHIEGNGVVEAPAFFAGYGFAVPSQGFDDLKGLDLRGKIAVIYAGSPSSVHGPLKAYFRTAGQRWKALKAAGAIGMITIPEPRQLQGGPPRDVTSARPVTLLADPELDQLRGLRLNATVPTTSAGVLFTGSEHSFDELFRIAQQGGQLPKFPLAISIQAATSVHAIKSFDSPNVVGMLEGSDSKLKHEYVVLSAHLDHLGEGRPVDGDAIYNGAMDNATGIASLIETAKALANGPRLKRSILFLAVTGEEEGELGSQFYARYPTVPRNRIVADLNMDMYLPLFPLHFLEVQGLGESTLGNDARAAAQLNDIEVQFDKQPDENRFIRSDQASFVKYGIPSLAFKFGWLPDTPEQKAFNDWIKTRYHRPSDDANQPISRAGAVRFDSILTTLTIRVANAAKRPSWYPESFFDTISTDF